MKKYNPFFGEVRSLMRIIEILRITITHFAVVRILRKKEQIPKPGDDSYWRAAKSL
jgi:hypothetical protein